MDLGDFANSFQASSLPAEQEELLLHLPAAWGFQLLRWEKKK